MKRCQSVTGLMRKFLNHGKRSKVEAMDGSLQYAKTRACEALSATALGHASVPLAWPSFVWGDAGPPPRWRERRFGGAIDLEGLSVSRKPDVQRARLTGRR